MSHRLLRAPAVLFPSPIDPALAHCYSMRVITKPEPLLRRVERHSAEGLTRSKMAALVEIARRWQAARERYIADYWGESFVELVLRHPRELRTRRQTSGWARSDLPVNFNKTALLSAFGVVRSNWLATTASAGKVVARRRDISPVERRWMHYVLESPRLLRDCLTGTALTHPSWAATLDETKTSKRLRRLLRRCRPPRPRRHRRPWLEIDCNLYRPFLRAEDRHFHGAWLALSSLERYRRIRIPLAGRDLEYLSPRAGVKGRPSLRIDLGVRVTFATVARVEPRPATGTTRAGVDKGFRDLFTISSGDPEVAERYGAAARDLITATADASANRGRQRRRLVSYARSLRNTDSAKSRRLRRSSLGRRKTSERSRVERARLREQVNAALNKLFAKRPDLRAIVAEDLRFRSRRRQFSHDVNRRLSRWTKGFMHRRLAYKAELNGVELIVVNAAYTSQTCTRCGFTDRRNRFGDRFKCGSCGYTGSADAVAATNVLRRGSDSAITRFSTVVEVKQILEARWRSALIGSARGSNAGPAVTSVTDSTQDEQRRTRGVAFGPKVICE